MTEISGDTRTNAICIGSSHFFFFFLKARPQWPLVGGKKNQKRIRGNAQERRWRRVNIYYFIIKKCKKVSILANCSTTLKDLCHCSRKNPKSEVLEWTFRFCLLMFAESQVRVGPDWRCWWVLDKGFPAARTFARRPVTTDSHPPNHPPPNHNAMLCVHGLSSSLFVNGLFINSCGLSHQTDIANGNEIRHERTTEIHMPFSRSWRVKLKGKRREMLIGLAGLIHALPTQRILSKLQICVEHFGHRVLIMDKEQT